MRPHRNDGALSCGAARHPPPPAAENYIAAGYAYLTFACVARGHLQSANGPLSSLPAPGRSWQPKRASFILEQMQHLEKSSPLVASSLGRIALNPSPPQRGRPRRLLSHFLLGIFGRAALVRSGHRLTTAQLANTTTPSLTSSSRQSSRRTGRINGAATDAAASERPPPFPPWSSASAPRGPVSEPRSGQEAPSACSPRRRSFSPMMAAKCLRGGGAELNGGGSAALIDW